MLASSDVIDVVRQIQLRFGLKKEEAKMTPIFNHSPFLHVESRKIKQNLNVMSSFFLKVVNP